jgi:hypothetical protein
MALGRPSEFKPEYVAQAKIMCEAGATDLEIAQEFGVTVQTIRNWRMKYPDFFAALKLSKPIADERVERSLYERATGYSYEAVKLQFDSKRGTWEEITYIEHVPPDSTAMIFWLKNRKPEEWRDRREISGPDGGAIPVANLTAEDFTDEQLAALIHGGK